MPFAAIEQNPRALLLTEADQRLHAFLALRRDDGTHLHAVFETVSNFELRGCFCDRVAEGLLRFADRNRGGDGETTLSGAAKGAVADDLRRHRHVGVGKNDDVILGSALALTTLPLLARACIDVTRYWSRSDKTNRTHLRMIDECVNDGFTAIHQIDYALG